MTEPRTSRPVVVTAAFLVGIGLLFFLMGAGFGVIGGLVAGSVPEGSPEADAGAASGAAIAVGVFYLGWGVVQAVAGAGVLAHRPWGRWLGLGVGVLGLGFYGLALVNGLAAGVVDGLNLVVVAGYGLAVLALATGGAHFRRT